MKKIFCTLLILLSITGCSLAKDMDNTPTKKVEAFLNKYQTLDTDILTDLDDIIEKEDSFTSKQKDEYKDIIKSNYQKLTYTIKDEKIDGNDAIVTTQIEVIDYTKIISESNKYLKDHPEEFLKNDEHDESLFVDYKLSAMKKAKEKIKYNIEFSLTRVEDEWILDNITNEIRDKINGNY